MKRAELLSLSRVAVTALAISVSSPITVYAQAQASEQRPTFANRNTFLIDPGGQNREGLDQGQPERPQRGSAREAERDA